MRGEPMASSPTAIAAMHQQSRSEARPPGGAIKSPAGDSLIIQLPTTSTSATTGGPSESRSRPSLQRFAGETRGSRQPNHRRRRHHRQQLPAAVRGSISQQHRAASESAYIRAYSACHHHQHASPTRDLTTTHNHRPQPRRSCSMLQQQQSEGVSETALEQDTQLDLEPDGRATPRHASGSSTSISASEGPGTSRRLSGSSDSISGDSVVPPPNYHEIPGIVPSYHGRNSGPPPAYDDVVNPNAQPPSYQSLFGQVREARKTSNGLVDLLRQLFLVLIGTIGCTMIIGFLLLIPITMIFVGVFYTHECRAENIPAFLVVGGFVWIVKNMLNCYNQFKKDSTQVNRPPARRARPAAAASVSPQAPLSAVVVAAASAGDRPADTGQANQESSMMQQDQTMTTAAGAPGAPLRSTDPHEQPPQAHSSTRRAQRQHIRQPPMIGLTSYKCESILNYFLLVWFLAGCIVVYRIYEPDYDNPLSASYCNRTVYLYAFWLMTSAFIIMAIVLSCLCCLMASSLISCSHGR